MQTNQKTDVIIIGAGPTGLSLACQLIRYGVDFVILEKATGVTPFSKALGVHARTLEIYEQLGLAEKALELGTITGKVRMLESGKVVGEVDLSNVGAGMSTFPFMLVLEQSVNERLMYDYVVSHDKDVLWQNELVNFTQSDTGVTAQVQDGNGLAKTIEGNYLVGCDGPRSLVRHTLGLKFEGSTFSRLFYVADVRLDWKFSHDALHGCLAPNGAVAFFPLPGEKRWRIVGAFPEGLERKEGEVMYEEVEARIREEAQLDLHITRVDWFSTYNVHTRHVDRFSKGRCFLAGDSAHIHTPAGGQGMNTGIQDVYNLAWKLALVLKYSANEKLLDSYNEERLPNAKRLTETTDRMFNLAAGNDWFVGLIRTTIFPPMARYILAIEAVRKKFFILISQIGIRYRKSSLSAHQLDSVKGGSHSESDEGSEVQAGDRFPYFLLDDKSIYDRLRAPKFHLLTFSDGEHEFGPIELPEGNSSWLEHHVIPLYPHIADVFGRDTSFNVLVRPDNYIAYISPDTSAAVLAQYLKRIF